MPSLALLAVFGLALLLGALATAVLRVAAPRAGRLRPRGGSRSSSELGIATAGGLPVFPAFVVPC